MHRKLSSTAINSLYEALFSPSFIVVLQSCAGNTKQIQDAQRCACVARLRPQSAAISGQFTGFPYMEGKAPVGPILQALGFCVSFPVS